MPGEPESEETEPEVSEPEVTESTHSDSEGTGEPELEEGEEPALGSFIIRGLHLINGENFVDGAGAPLAEWPYQWCQFFDHGLDCDDIELTDEEGSAGIVSPIDIAGYRIALIDQTRWMDGIENQEATESDSGGTGDRGEGEPPTSPESGTADTIGESDTAVEGTPETGEVPTTPQPIYNQELLAAIAGVGWDALIGGSEAETFRRNDGRRDKVMVVQRILNTIGYYIGRDGMDGHFGRCVESAVKKFQRLHVNQTNGTLLTTPRSNLGIVDHETLKSMLCQLVRISAIPYQMTRAGPEREHPLIFHILQSRMEEPGIEFDHTLVQRIANGPNTPDDVIIRVLQQSDYVHEVRARDVEMPDITPCRSQTDNWLFARCIVTTLEAGGDYGAVQNRDSGIVTYGGFQCTVRSGCLWKLLCRWLHWPHAQEQAPEQFAVILDRMKTARMIVSRDELDPLPDPEHATPDDVCPGDWEHANRADDHPIHEFATWEELRTDQEFHTALERAAAAPSMREAQDFNSRTLYYDDKAVPDAHRDGLSSRIAFALYYDCANWGFAALNLSREYTFEHMEREGISRNAVSERQMSERDFLHRYLDGQSEYLRCNVSDVGNLRRRPSRIAVLRNMIDIELPEEEESSRENHP